MRTIFLCLCSRQTQPGGLQACLPTTTRGWDGDRICFQLSCLGGCWVQRTADRSSTLSLGRERGNLRTPSDKPPQSTLTPSLWYPRPRGWAAGARPGPASAMGKEMLGRLCRHKHTQAGCNLEAWAPSEGPSLFFP